MRNDWNWWFYDRIDRQDANQKTIAVESQSSLFEFLHKNDFRKQT